MSPVAPAPDRRVRLLLLGGTVTAAASLLHLGIVLGGPAWYRFFGAGEEMARLAERGHPYPPALTAAIAAVLAVWALYAFSAAGRIRRLPLLRPALALIAAVFLARGLLGIPAVLLLDDPHSLELRARPVFMLVSSLVCVGLGVCYAAGLPLARAGRRGAPSPPTPEAPCPSSSPC